MRDATKMQLDNIEQDVRTLRGQHEHYTKDAQIRMLATYVHDLIKFIRDNMQERQ